MQGHTQKKIHMKMAHNRYKVINSCTHVGDFSPSHTFTILLVAFSMAHMQLAYSKIAHTHTITQTHCDTTKKLPLQSP